MAVPVAQRTPASLANMHTHLEVLHGLHGVVLQRRNQVTDALLAFRLCASPRRILRVLLLPAQLLGDLHDA